MKRAPPSYEEDDTPQVDKAKIANFRRLSTLYGSNISTVAKTKNRKSKRMNGMAPITENQGKGAGRASPAFSMGSQQSMSSFGGARGRTQSQETVGTKTKSGRGRTQSQESTRGRTQRYEVVRSEVMSWECDIRRCNFSYAGNSSLNTQASFFAAPF